MLLTTTDSLPNKDYEILGMVKGSCIQTKNLGKDISQTFKNIVGGELKSYTKMMDESRSKATQRMIIEASNIQADAIIAVRYATSAIMQGAAEVFAYGTAVKFK